MSKYGFDKMKVGDTVMDPGGCATGDASYNNAMYMAAVMYGRRNGKRFRGRKVEGGIVIERVE